MEEKLMDSILSDILEREHPKLYQYLGLMVRMDVPIEDILARVANQTTSDTALYRTIEGTLHHLERIKEGNS